MQGWLRRVRWLVLCALPWSAMAQQATLSMDEPVPSMDVFRGVISQLGNANNGWGHCFGPQESVGTVRPVVEAELQRMGVAGLPTSRQVSEAISSRFPCPFVPYRSGIRAATAQDVQGAWITSPGSERLRYPQRSPAWSQEPPAPFRCEVVGYFAGGEARTIEIRGTRVACPEKADDMAAARALPRVSNWAISPEGRLTVSRTDVAGHMEEWEMFVVEQPFELSRISFRAGDLLAYLRKTSGVNGSYAMRFRHLQRLR